MKYLQHLLVAHSPDSVWNVFVRELHENVIKDDRWFYAFYDLEGVRKSLYRNQNSLPLIDYGEGSNIRAKNETTISEVAKTSLSHPYQCRMMFRLVDFLKARSIIEIGTSLGISTAYLASSSNDISVTTLEGNPASLDVARHIFNELQLHQINSVLGEFSVTLSQTLKNIKEIDLAFLDGHHNESATTQYFEMLLPKCHEGSCVIVDDIYWSEGMTRVWNTIQKHKQVSLTIDLFFCGLVFFNSRESDNEEPSHFKFKPGKLLFHL